MINRQLAAKREKTNSSSCSIRMLERFGSFSRWVQFDKRGTGASDRRRYIPGLDERVEDLRAVMDDAGVERAFLYGASEGGPMCVLFAATYPERVDGLILHGTTASYRQEGATDEERAASAARRVALAGDWGTPNSPIAQLFSPSLAGDAKYCTWLQRYERLSAENETRSFRSATAERLRRLSRMRSSSSTRVTTTSGSLATKTGCSTSIPMTNERIRRSSMHCLGITSQRSLARRMRPGMSLSLKSISTSHASDPRPPLALTPGSVLRVSGWVSATPRRVMGLPAVFLLAATAGVAQSFGRFAFGVVLPAIRADLGLSNTVAGSLATVNVGAYLAGTLAVAAIAGSYKLLAIMRIGFVFALLGLVLAAIAPGVWVVALAMLFSGFGGALIWIPAPAIAASAMPPEKRSVAIGLMGTGMGAGVVFASQLSSYVRSSMGDESWRTVYVVLAVIAFVVLAATFLFVGHEQDRPTSGTGGFGGFTALKRMRAWVPLTSAYTSFGFMYLLILAFLATRLEDDSGWTSSRASLAFTLVGVAMMFGGPLFITIATRIGSRKGLAIAFTGWVIVVLLILPGWFAVTLPASIAVGLCFAGIPSMITLYVVQNTTVEDYGPSFAAATLAFGVAQMISPQLGGVLADLTGSFTVVFLLSAALAVTGLIAALKLPRRSEQLALNNP